MAAMLAHGAGLRLTAVPYRGSAKAVTDVSVGRVGCTFADFGIGVAQQRAGRIRALAESSAKPFPLASEVPGFDANVWFSLVAPAAPPADIVERAAAVLDEVLDTQQFREKLANLGLAPLRMGPAALGVHLRLQLALWGERVRLAGIEPQ